MNTTRTISITLIFAITLGGIAMAQWKPVEGQLMTRWAKDVSPGNVWPEYPRPQMTRDQWQNLNGLWDYAITPAPPIPDPLPGRPNPGAVRHRIRPVRRQEGQQPDQTLWYRRTFPAPETPTDNGFSISTRSTGNVPLVNGTFCGRHQGGYDPFYFDITAR